MSNNPLDMLRDHVPAQLLRPDFLHLRGVEIRKAAGSNGDLFRAIHRLNGKELYGFESPDGLAVWLDAVLVAAHVFKARLCRRYSLWPRLVGGRWAVVNTTVNPVKPLVIDYAADLDAARRKCFDLSWHRHGEHDGGAYENLIAWEKSGHSHYMPHRQYHAALDPVAIRAATTWRQVAGIHTAGFAGIVHSYTL